MTARPGLLIAGALAMSIVVGCSVSAPVEPPAPGWGQVEPVPAGPSQVLPIALRISKIGLDGRDWVEVGIDDNGVVEVPDVRTPRKMGWFCPAWKWTLRATPDDPDCGAPVPGEVGPAVVIAHNVGAGKPGAFKRVHELDLGDLIEVDRSDGLTAVFAVTKVRTVDKTAFPTQAVYGDTTKAQLTLVTCGTTYVGKRSTDQVLVWSELVSLRPTQLTAPAK